MSSRIVLPNAGPDYEWSKDHVYIKTTTEQTGGRVTLVEDTLKPGFHLPRHHHKAMMEIFYVLDGEATFAFDDHEVVATRGTVITTEQLEDQALVTQLGEKYDQWT